MLRSLEKQLGGKGVKRETVNRKMHFIFYPNALLSREKLREAIDVYMQENGFMPIERKEDEDLYRHPFRGDQTVTLTPAVGESPWHIFIAFSKTLSDAVEISELTEAAQRKLNARTATI